MENKKNKTIINLEDEVIEKISTENLKPKAKWKFVFKNWMLFVLGGLSILLGALAFSSILYFFQPGEIEILRHSGANWKELLLFFLPYFWLIFLIIFLLAAWYYFKHTEKGYRYSLPVIFAFSILCSVILGSVFYGSGIAGLMDDFLGRQPFYGDLVNPRAKFWLNPGSGRIGGVVIEKRSNQDFTVYDKRLGQWQIITATGTGIVVKEGLPIMVVGHRISSDNVFFAEETFFPPLGREFLCCGGVTKEMIKNPVNK